MQRGGFGRRVFLQPLNALHFHADRTSLTLSRSAFDIRFIFHNLLAKFSVFRIPEVFLAFPLGKMTPVA
jgi:hypothetical protein